jgi:hypothetical protein
VDDIRASVPYHFDVMGSNSDLPRNGKPRLEKIGARRAHLLLWPLTIAMGATGTPSHQKKWIRCRILDVSKITGNGAEWTRISTCEEILIALAQERFKEENVS